MMQDLKPPHPGEILVEEFMKPHGLTPGRLAKRMLIARPRIEKLSRGLTPVTVDTALRLARVFGSTPEFWMNLQVRYDLEIARAAADPSIAEITPL